MMLYLLYCRFGPRFLGTVDTWDAGLRALAATAAQELNMGNSIRQGTYIMIGGPTFETVAESRLLRNFGADSVGM